MSRIICDRRVYTSTCFSFYASEKNKNSRRIRLKLPFTSEISYIKFIYFWEIIKEKGMVARGLKVQLHEVYIAPIYMIFEVGNDYDSC